MKTFTAEQFSNKPAQVFREADINGSVKINHQHYPDKVFILEGRERGVNNKPVIEGIDGARYTCNQPAHVASVEHRQAQRKRNYESSKMVENAALGIPSFVTTELGPASGGIGDDDNACFSGEDKE